MPKKKTSFYLDEEILRKLVKLAEENNRSQSNMLEYLITEAFKKVKK